MKDNEVAESGAPNLSTKSSSFATVSITVYIFAEDTGPIDPSGDIPMCVTNHGDLA